MPTYPLVAEGKPGKLLALTSIRFFAAMLVVLYHTIFLIDPVFANPIDLRHSSIFTRIISLGYVSVSFFFLLSGYILATVYLQRSTKISLRHFYVARLARVYPLFFITLILDTPYLFLLRMSKYGLHEAIDKSLLTLGASAMMLQAWIPRLGGINFPSWSLSVEALLYLLFPFVAATLWRLKGRQVAVAGLVVYLSGQAAVLFASAHLSTEISSRLPLLHVTTFVSGIILARWQFLRQISKERTPRSDLQVQILASAVVASGACVVIAISSRLPTTVLNDGLLSPIFASLILLLSRTKGPVRQIFEARWLVILGEASYALYLLHIPILHAYLWLGCDRFPLLYPFYLAGCLGISIGSYYLVEAPLRRWVCHLLPSNPVNRIEFAKRPAAALKQAQ